MSRLRKLCDNKEYQYKYDLNWRDDGNGSLDGQGIEDPSINDFLKGYQLEPYEFKQWSRLRKGLEKKAWAEVDVLEFSPSYLADKILKLWNSSDGLLQNFYDSFTLRYNNKLKIAIANELKTKGYTVYPLLIEDRPIYAKHKKILKKIMSSNNVKFIKNYIKNARNNEKHAFKTSIAVNELLEEIKEYEEYNNKDIEFVDFSNLVDYYSLIYPKDYAISLIKGITIKDERNTEKNLFNYYDNFCMSNESLSAIEKYLSGNQDPISFNDNGVNGYDFVSDTRYDTTIPNSYEVNASKKKRLRLQK